MPTQLEHNALRADAKRCVQCGELKPLAEFRRRSGAKAGSGKRRGTCRDCRRRMAARETEPARVTPKAAAPEAAGPRKKRRRRKRRGGREAQLHAQPTAAAPAPARPDPIDPWDASALRPTRRGFIRMRGKTDNGRRWYQEVAPELAATLVRERAAVVVNRHTIRRLYSNKEFRQLILTRDGYTCRFCGQYGDTIDHLLPRAKGGHTTPVNCVCACSACNQSKADRDLGEFIDASD